MAWARQKLKERNELKTAREEKEKYLLKRKIAYYAHLAPGDISNLARRYTLPNDPSFEDYKKLANKLYDSRDAILNGYNDGKPLYSCIESTAFGLLFKHLAALHHNKDSNSESLLEKMYGKHAIIGPIISGSGRTSFARNTDKEMYNMLQSLLANTEKFDYNKELKDITVKLCFKDAIENHFKYLKTPVPANWRINE